MQPPTPSEKELSAKFSQLYWLGGAPCSGKSTIADLLGDQYSIAVYHIDEAVRTRFGPYDSFSQPCMYRWTNPAGSDAFWDDTWMRPVDVLLDEVIQCYQEQFELVVAELLDMQTSHPLLVEGNSLLPHALTPLITQPSHAVWMTPTARFQRKTYPQRGQWVRDILAQCTDPDGALLNWMDRDAAFAERIAAQVTELGYMLITVDGKRSIEQNAESVAKHFRWQKE